MSQQQFFGDGGSPSFLGIETITPNTGGAVPGAGTPVNLNLLGGSGIETYFDALYPNTVFVKVQNSTTSTGQTVDNATIDLSTIDCSVAGTYFFTTQICAYSTDGTQALGGVLYTTAISDGASLTVVDDTDSIAHRTAGLPDINYEITSSATDAVLQVTGQNTFTLNWGAITIFVFRGL